MNRFVIAVTGSIRAAFIFFLLAGGAQAEIYKWVDENGEVHYTQSPPPAGVTADTIQPPPQPDTENAIKQLTDQELQFEESRKQRQEQGDNEAKAAEDLARKQKNCEIAKKNLASYDLPRVKRVQEDGTIVTITEEDRQDEIKKSGDMVAEFCN